MSKQLICDICKQSFCSSDGFSRWDLNFCTNECYDVQLKIETKKEEENLKKHKKNNIKTMSYYDVGRSSF